MRRRLTFLAGLSVLACAAAATWGYSLQPERWGRWLFVALLLPGLWGFLELAQAGSSAATKVAILNWHRTVIAATGLLLALSVGPLLAVKSGLLSPELLPLLARARGALAGIALAVWGNYLPKIRSPWKLEEEPFDWQRVHRFCGWLAVACGLGVAAVWLLLPLVQAGALAKTLLVTFAVVGVTRKWISVFTHTPKLPPRGRERALP